jgi:hypothetical protein
MIVWSLRSVFLHASCIGEAQSVRASGTAYLKECGGEVPGPRSANSRPTPFHLERFLNDQPRDEGSSFGRLPADSTHGRRLQDPNVLKPLDA